MLWCYDNAICEDLRQSFNPEAVADPLVKVVSPEEAIGLAAQLQNDELQFPIVALTRGDGYEIDTDLTNFTKLHKGITTVFDPVNNEYYMERSLPIKVSYALTVITTSVADMDEIIKELVFKYSSMYFLTLEVPYESKRKIRFGIEVEPSGITSGSTTKDYIESGKLYQSILPMRCIGTVLLSYTPVKLPRLTEELHIVDKQNIEPYIVSVKE